MEVFRTNAVRWTGWEYEYSAGRGWQHDAMTSEVTSEQATCVIARCSAPINNCIEPPAAPRRSTAQPSFIRLTFLELTLKFEL